MRTVEESASTVHVVGARGQIGLFLWPAVLLLPGMAPHIFSLPSFALGRHLTYYPSNNFGIGRGFWTFSFIFVDDLFSLQDCFFNQVKVAIYFLYGFQRVGLNGKNCVGVCERTVLPV